VTDHAALAYVRERLRRAGVDRALARAGAREGDQVRIGAITFEYGSDDLAPGDDGDDRDRPRRPSRPPRKGSRR
jgi:GTP-binding protein